MASGLAHIDQLSPQRIAWGKLLPHGHPQSSIALLAACNLRRQRQELLRHQTLLVEVGRQAGPTFEQYPLDCVDPADLVEDSPGRDQRPAGPNRADVNAPGYPLLGPSR